MTTVYAGWSATRRTALRSAAIGLFAFHIAGCKKWLTPEDARRQGAAYQVLTPGEAALLDAFGEALVPGARQAGVAHYVDANLSRPHAESLLTLRYLDVPPPHDQFYRDGLNALDRSARAMLGKPFAEASVDQSKPLIAALLPGRVSGWAGPPQPLFYLAVRGDAADLVYGTRAAFERMNLPYIPHIEPPGDW